LRPAWTIYRNSVKKKGRRMEEEEGRVGGRDRGRKERRPSIIRVGTLSPAHSTGGRDWRK
jgi:hypothetical protein